MMESLAKQVLQILNQQKKKQRWLILFLCLAVLVTGGTLAALKMNGQALTHKKLVCEVTAPVAHAHNSDCYDDKGELVCPLPEIELHTHGSECYGEQVLICEQEKTDDHVHTDACYKTADTPACGEVELKEHIHDEGCFEVVEVTGEEKGKLYRKTFEDSMIRVEMEYGEKANISEDAELRAERIDEKAKQSAEENVEATERVKIKIGVYEGEEEIKPEDTVTFRIWHPGVDGSKGKEPTVIVYSPEDNEESLIVEFDLKMTGEELEENGGLIQKVYEDSAIRVTVEYGESAELPEEAELKVERITAEKDPELFAEREEEFKNVLEDEDAALKILFDIGFYVNGKEVEPADTVTVMVQFLDEEGIPVGAPMKVVHFAENKTELLSGSDVDKEGLVTFTTDSFSPFAFFPMFATYGVGTNSARATGDPIYTFHVFVNGKWEVAGTLTGYDASGADWAGDDPRKPNYMCYYIAADRIDEILGKYGYSSSAIKGEKGKEERWIAHTNEGRDDYRLLFVRAEDVCQKNGKWMWMVDIDFNSNGVRGNDIYYIPGHNASEPFNKLSGKDEWVEFDTYLGNNPDFEVAPLPDVTICKTDSKNPSVRLSGAVFVLRDSAGNEVEGTLTTDDQGMCKAAGLKDGTYTLTEKAAPEGYVLPESESDRTVTFTVSDGKITSVSGSMIEKRGDLELAIKNEPLVETLADITVYKIDSEDPSIRLDGAGFELSGGPADDQKNESFTTADGGKYTIEGLKDGTYTLTETKAPEGYVLPESESDRTVTFTVSDGKITSVSGSMIVEQGDLELTIKNEPDVPPLPESVTARFFKTNKASSAVAEKKLSGAGFTLYRVPNEGERGKSVSVPGFGRVSVITVGSGESNGAGAFLENIESLPVGTYYLVETKAPVDYIKLENAIKFEVKQDVENRKVFIAVDGSLAETAKANETADKDIAGYPVWEIKVSNTHGFKLPETGGIGVNSLRIGGALLAMTAASLMYGCSMRRKQKERRLDR